MPQTNLKEILRLELKRNTIGGTEKVDIENFIETAHKAINDWFEQEIIGKDDFITEYSGNSRFDQQVTSEVDGANRLRAEQRAKLTAHTTHTEEKK